MIHFYFIKKTFSHLKIAKIAFSENVFKIATFVFSENVFATNLYKMQVNLLKAIELNAF